MTGDYKPSQLEDTALNAPNFQKLFESAPALYLVLSTDLRIVAASDAYLRATMIERESILGKGIFEVFPDNPDDPSATGVTNLKSSLERVLRSAAPDVMAVQKYDIRRPETEGGGYEERFWSPVNSPVYGPDGNVEQIIHRVEDVTEYVRLKQRRAEREKDYQDLRHRSERMEAEVFLRTQEIQEANRKLKEANEELHLAHVRLSEADRRKDEFLAMLAHELRNPLAPLRSGMDLLSLKSEGEDRSIVALMQDQVEHLVRLVDDLLDVSRIMCGRIELRKEAVEVSALVKRSLDTLRPMIESHQHKLHVSYPEQPVWLNADPVRLLQVLENLLVNASKYTEDGGEIHVKVERQNDYAVINVQDTGIGIEADLLPKVFDLFTQSSRSLDRAQGGLGIGLTLAQSLVAMHGGTLAAESEGKGHGSAFIVQLPVVAPPKAAESTADEQSSTNQARRVLVVDDNRAAAQMLSLLLRELGCSHVEAVYDGNSARQKVADFRPHIVLLDIGMPGKDGFQVAREIREGSEFDDVLLVALTGYGQEADRRKCKEAGFDVHLVKPPSLKQLKDVLAHPKLVS